MRQATDDARPNQVVAVCGKGGVGKTTVAAMLARAMAVDRGRRTLAVDADHAGGLAMALGLEPRLTLEDVRREAADDARGESAGSRDDLQRAVDYRLLQALGEQGRLGLLSLGRPGGRGCFCGVNRLMRTAIDELARQFDVALVDAEAGIEQINRDVIGEVDYLLLVSDASAKGLRVAETIVEVRRSLGHDTARGLLLNRITGGEDEARAVATRTALDLVGWLPEDEAIRRFDSEQRSFLTLEDCPARRAIEATIASLWPAS